MSRFSICPCGMYEMGGWVYEMVEGLGLRE